MGCHPFHMFCGCIVKVWQKWDIINTMGSCLSKPQSTQAVGLHWELQNTTRPSSGLCMLWIEKQWAMDGLWCIPCVSWVHVGQGMTRLKPNQYTGVVSIQASEYPSCGTRFGENCKTVMTSSDWCMLLHDEQHAMNGLSPIPHVLWVHGQTLTSMGHNQYTRVLFIHTLEHPRCGTTFGETSKPPIHPRDWVYC